MWKGPVTRSQLKRQAIMNGYPEGLAYSDYVDQIMRDYPEIVIEDDCNEFKNKLRRECKM